eukprot:3013940-Amphidinium_carterae.1
MRVFAICCVGSVPVQPVQCVPFTCWKDTGVSGGVCSLACKYEVGHTEPHLFLELYTGQFKYSPYAANRTIPTRIKCRDSPIVQAMVLFGLVDL